MAPTAFMLLVGLSAAAELPMSYISHGPSDPTPISGSWCVDDGRGDKDARFCLTFLHTIFQVTPQNVTAPLLSGALVRHDGGAWLPAQVPSVFETHLVDGLRQVWTFNIYSPFIGGVSPVKELCVAPWARDPATGDVGKLEAHCADVGNVTVVSRNPITSIHSRLLFGNWTQACTHVTCRLMGHVAIQVALPGVVSPAHGEMAVSLDNGTTWEQSSTAIVSSLSEFDLVDKVWYQRFHVAFDRYIPAGTGTIAVCMKTWFADEQTLERSSSDFSAVVQAKSGGFLGETKEIGCWQVGPSPVMPMVMV